MGAKRVIIAGWRAGFKKVSFNDLLREHAGMGLVEAKSVVDRLLDGETVEVRLPDGTDSDMFVTRATELGAIVEDQSQDK